jgi:hypothetical protein
MNRFSYTLLAIALCTACGQGNKKPEQPGEVVMPATDQPADQLVNHYIQLKDALVKDDIQQVNNIATVLAKSAQPDSAQLKTLPPEQQTGFLTLCRELQGMVASVNAAADLKSKRSVFRNMTLTMRQVAENYGTGKIPVYQQHCPMAFNDTGASWLSLETKIRNPYLPKTMLRCGLVEDTLKHKQ